MYRTSPTPAARKPANSRRTTLARSWFVRLLAGATSRRTSRPACGLTMRPTHGSPRGASSNLLRRGSRPGLAGYSISARTWSGPNVASCGTRIRLRIPSEGAAICMLVLTTTTSAIGCPSCTWAPSKTSQRSMSASVPGSTPRHASSGRHTATIRTSPGAGTRVHGCSPTRPPSNLSPVRRRHKLADRACDVFHLRDDRLFERSAIRNGHVRYPESLYGGLHRNVSDLLRDQCRDLPAQAEFEVVLVGDQQAARLGYRAQYGLAIEGDQRAQVEHLDTH